MTKKFLSFIFLLSLSSIGFSNSLEKLPVDNSTDVIEEIVSNLKKLERETIKVKLNYKWPKIQIKDGIYYVNNKPYRGKVYMYNNLVINEVNLEDYLYSVVSSEMPTYFGMEALKAQSVAARSYAMFLITNNKYDGFDIYDGVSAQVYKGMSAEKEEVILAVNQTKGEILTYDDKPILAVYHSSAGDTTFSSKEVFGRHYPYLVPAPDFTSQTKWSYKIKKSTLESKMRKPYSSITKLNNNSIRKALGPSKIRSNNFQMYQSGDYIYFNGLGYGHGVGLSQYGAKYLSNEKDYSYKEILYHYYPNTVLKQLGELDYE